MSRHGRDARPIRRWTCSWWARVRPASARRTGCAGRASPTSWWWRPARSGRAGGSGGRACSCSPRAGSARCPGGASRRDRPGAPRGWRWPATWRPTRPTSGCRCAPGRRCAGSSGTTAASGQPRRPGAIRARHVVLATGPFRASPRAGRGRVTSAPEVRQLHSSQYRRPEDVPPGRVLVVGGWQLRGAAGRRAVGAGREVDGGRSDAAALPARGRPGRQHLLVAPGHRHPQRRSVDAAGPVPAQPARGDPRPAAAAARARRPVRLVPHPVVGADGARLRLADGSTQAPDTVLWCTGFEPDTAWIDVPGASGRTARPGTRRGLAGAGSALDGVAVADPGQLVAGGRRRPRRPPDGAADRTGDGRGVTRVPARAGW